MSLSDRTRRWRNQRCIETSRKDIPKGNKEQEISIGKAEQIRVAGDRSSGSQHLDRRFFGRRRTLLVHRPEQALGATLMQHDNAHTAALLPYCSMANYQENKKPWSGASLQQAWSREPLQEGCKTGAGSSTNKKTIGKCYRPGRAGKQEPSETNRFGRKTTALGSRAWDPDRTTGNCKLGDPHRCAQVHAGKETVLKSEIHKYQYLTRAKRSATSERMGTRCS